MCHLRNLSASEIRTFGPIGVNKLKELGEISGLRRKVDDKCVLLGYNAEHSGNLLATFPDKLSVGSIGYPETSVINYCYSLPNSPKERNSYRDFLPKYNRFFVKHPVH